MFGNASEDMRVVLTWRKLDKNQPGGTSQRWKLRKSSVEGLDENGNEEDINGTSSSFGGTGGKDRGGRGAWDSKQKGGKRQAYDEGQYKVGGRRASGVSNASEDESSSLLKRGSSTPSNLNRRRSSTKSLKSLSESLDGKDEQSLKKRNAYDCLLYTSPSPRDKRQSRMPSSA